MNAKLCLALALCFIVLASEFQSGQSWWHRRRRRWVSRRRRWVARRRRCHIHHHYHYGDMKIQQLKQLKDDNMDDEYNNQLKELHDFIEKSDGSEVADGEIQKIERLVQNVPDYEAADADDQGEKEHHHGPGHGDQDEEGDRVPDTDDEEDLFN